MPTLFTRHQFLALLVILVAAVASTGWAGTTPPALTEVVSGFASRNFKEKEAAAEAVAQSGEALAAPLLTALLDGRLFLHKQDGRLIIANGTPTGSAPVDALSGALLDSIPTGELKKITINNSLRGRLKTLIARIYLTSADPERRLAAVQSMYDDGGAERDDLLRELLRSETKARIREAATAVLALGGLKSEDPKRRQQALEELAGNLDPMVFNEISRLADTEEEPAIRAQARRLLTGIEQKRAWFIRLETVFFGLSLGSVLVLAAIGLAITFGVVGVINMAHGELIMIGAYTTYVLQQLLADAAGLALILAIPVAFIVSGLVGIAIERSVIRFLYGRPLETLLATFGISLILQQAVRSVFSPLNRSVATPEWLSGSIVINPVLSLTTNRVVIFFFMLLVFALLFLLLKKSALGLHVRAVSQNRAMARAMGIRAARVDALTFGLGSGIAGIAGVALSQLTNVGPNLGQAYIVDSFMVVVFGGVGNLWGTLLGGLSLGVANKFLEPWSGAVLAKIVILVGIILFIQKRPQGLFPQRGRAAE
ncbi:MAG: urea ABC transporter permease subunit UrtB [Desulfofustis sp.]|nr:urea ABC transporter permease subunit UrtB [Desulfofustis sp.]